MASDGRVVRSRDPGNRRKADVRPGRQAGRIRQAEPNTADEPLAKEFSLTRTAAFLDSGSVWWTGEKKCGTCHTNFPYLMARPLLKETPLAGHDEVRAFFEDRIAHWDDDARRARPSSDTEVVATACVLAINDAQTTGKLHPLTRRALDKMWTLQLKGGAWDWAKCRWPPFEHDDYFGAVFAAVGVGSAPEDYAHSASAKEGLARLQSYLKRTSVPNLHHKAWLMWASVKLDGLMTQEERANDRGTTGPSAARWWLEPAVSGLLAGERPKARQ